MLVKEAGSCELQVRLIILNAFPANVRKEHTTNRKLKHLQTLCEGVEVIGIPPSTQCTPCGSAEMIVLLS